MKSHRSCFLAAAMLAVALSSSAFASATTLTLTRGDNIPAVDTWVVTASQPSAAASVTANASHNIESATMKTMRAKLKINRVEQHGTSETLHFNAVSKSGAYPADGSDEDNTFAKFSPSATLAIQITNPELVGQFRVGENYYVDFTSVVDRETQTIAAADVGDLAQVLGTAAT